MTKQEQLKGFTLLELLIVIAILSILAMALILVLNPAETLKKSRDTQRMTDLSTVKTALGLYLTNVTTPNLAKVGAEAVNARCVDGSGTDSIFYSGTVTAATVATSFAAYDTNQGVGTVDGNGWLPIDLTAISSGSPISNFPMDPVNTEDAGTITNSALIYRYACNATSLTYEIDARLESSEFAAKMTADGGDNDLLYETGSKLDILPSTNDF